MEDAVLAPIQSAKSSDYSGEGSGFNAAVKPSERTTSDPDETKPGAGSHGMEDPALTPVQAEPKKCNVVCLTVSAAWLHSLSSTARLIDYLLTAGLSSLRRHNELACEQSTWR